MKITKQQLKHIYEVLEKEEISYLQQTISEWYPELFKETELEVGKWYKRINKNGTDFLLNYQGDGNTSYGFWNSDYDTWDFSSSNLGLQVTPATDKEVKEALTKEIKKRGLWDTPIKCLNGEHNWNNDKSYGREFSNNIVWTEYGVVFRDGVFADKLETITKEEAEKQLGKIIE
jgi:hypothetical protein